ncbi:MAG: tetratricopeptide repeat protein [Candidatus Omnitrophica bacterium]|nr:tetratricopeptide repeat protein [Candidatus Omnitrophota bacterium]
MPKTAKLFILLIILAAIFSYLNSLNNEFIWDDEDFVLKNSTIKDWHKWPHVFTENMIHSARKGSNFYRPMQSLTHGIDYILWKDKTSGHHVANIIFHILASIMAYLLLRKIFSNNLSFLAALFFAVHPVQTEVVTYISGRSDSMAAFFIMLAILLFERNIILACLSFVLAVLSKESAMIAPFLLIVYLLFKNGTIKQQIKKIFPFIVILFIYGALRLTVLNFSKTVGENLPQPFFYVPLYIRFLTFLKALPVYFSILAWPFGLHMERQMSLARSIFEPQVFSGLLLLAGIFFIAYKLKKFDKAMLFSACWFFTAIFPNSNIIPINALIYEHWLYLPSLGFFITIAWLLEKLLKRENMCKYTAIFIVITIALFCIWRTHERNREWRDHISFYESAIKYVPDSGRLHNNLAMAYSDKGRIEDAVREYEKAISLGDYYPQTHFNLSNIYISKGNYEKAMKELTRSIEIDNNFLYSHETLAVLYFNQGKFREARNEAEFILKSEPDNKIAGEILRKLSEKGIF